MLTGKVYGKQMIFLDEKVYENKFYIYQIRNLINGYK